MNTNLINSFENFTEFVQSIDEQLWLMPVSPGKWTVKEVIAHLWSWDLYTIEIMLPLMKNNAKLPEFIDHDTHNIQAIEKAKQFKDRESLIKSFVEKRTYLANRFREIGDKEMRFIIGNDKRPYSLERYIKIFVHHDEHHRKQIELIK